MKTETTERCLQLCDESTKSSLPQHMLIKLMIRFQSRLDLLYKEGRRMGIILATEGTTYKKENLLGQQYIFSDFSGILEIKYMTKFLHIYNAFLQNL